mmetsp:Transcript_69277/g.153238  ORF Transcript_69277/g.153238 Transcript_69277/m.153238 type:complete len:220 (-) Transcript_69277:282-941(-)
MAARGCATTTHTLALHVAPFTIDGASILIVSNVEGQVTDRFERGMLNHMSDQALAQHPCGVGVRPLPSCAGGERIPSEKDLLPPSIGARGLGAEGLQGEGALGHGEADHAIWNRSFLLRAQSEALPLVDTQHNGTRLVEDQARKVCEFHACPLFAELKPVDTALQAVKVGKHPGVAGLELPSRSVEKPVRVAQLLLEVVEQSLILQRWLWRLRCFAGAI